jgi:hypothetical protein
MTFSAGVWTDQSLAAEKVKVDRLAVAKVKGDRGATIKHEFWRNLVELRPESPLCGRQNIQARDEIRHQQSYHDALKGQLFPVDSDEVGRQCEGTVPPSEQETVLWVRGTLLS